MYKQINTNQHKYTNNTHIHTTLSGCASALISSSREPDLSVHIYYLCILLTCVYTYVHILIGIYIYKYILIRLEIYIHVYIYMYVHTYIYTYNIKGTYLKGRHCRELKISSFLNFIKNS
jgi:CBS domain containing-hemolysin-like protein